MNLDGNGDRKIDDAEQAGDQGSEEINPVGDASDAEEEERLDDEAYAAIRRQALNAKPFEGDVNGDSQLPAGVSLNPFGELVYAGDAGAITSLVDETGAKEQSFLEIYSVVDRRWPKNARSTAERLYDPINETYLLVNPVATKIEHDPETGRPVTTEVHIPFERLDYSEKYARCALELERIFGTEVAQEVLGLAAGYRRIEDSAGYVTVNNIVEIDTLAVIANNLQELETELPGHISKLTAAERINLASNLRLIIHYTALSSAKGFDYYYRNPVLIEATRGLRDEVLYFAKNGGVQITGDDSSKWSAVIGPSYAHLSVNPYDGSGIQDQVPVYGYRHMGFETISAPTLARIAKRQSPVKSMRLSEAQYPNHRSNASPEAKRATESNFSVSFVPEGGVMRVHELIVRRGSRRYLTVYYGISGNQGAMIELDALEIDPNIRGRVLNHSGARYSTGKVIINLTRQTVDRKEKTTQSEQDAFEALGQELANFGVTPKELVLLCEAEPQLVVDAFAGAEGFTNQENPDNFKNSLKKALATKS